MLREGVKKKNSDPVIKRFQKGGQRGSWEGERVRKMFHLDQGKPNGGEVQCAGRMLG